jgi:hypothetical protein
VDDLKCVCDDANCHELLAVVAALHHQTAQSWSIQYSEPTKGGQCAPVNQSLDNRHLRLLELLLGITSSGVRQVDSMADLDVIRQGDVFHFDTISQIFPVNKISSRKCDRK